MLPSKASIAPCILLLFTDIRSPAFSKLFSNKSINTQRKIHPLRLHHDAFKELMSAENNAYLVINEEVKQQAQMGLSNQESITDMANTIQWLNETYGLIHLKTFVFDSSNLPWTSKLIYSVGTETKLSRPYGML